MNLGRAGAALLTVVLSVGLAGCEVANDIGGAEVSDQDTGGASAGDGQGTKDDNDGALAMKVLATLAVKGRAAATGYDRDQFGTAWKDVDHNGCDTRNDVLKRDLTGEKFKAGKKQCVVMSGTLEDRYTGDTIKFAKADASLVQIDHVVALENAWVTGAFQWSEAKRSELANDPLNLLAADGSTNSSKGSGDAATWLPPNKSFRCDYVARQVAVKSKYGNWVTKAEKKAISGVLKGCDGQRVPTSKAVAVTNDKAASKTSKTEAKDTDPDIKSKNGDVETPGAFCSPEGGKAKDSDGDTLTCSVKGDDDRARWRSS